MGIMNFITNPNKRMRLDLQSNYCTNTVNDDLWGQEDITAEEFDMLEVQATQETSVSNNFKKPLPRTSANNDISFQAEATKQEQYELEGKIKILSDSLETLKKELIEEKIKKENTIADKVREFQLKEKSLQKEIEKIQSSLLFKEQEMKTVYTKVSVLEKQVKEYKEKNTTPPHQSPNKFLAKFNFHTNTETSEIQQCSSISRKYKLCLDTPQGNIKGQDIVSSILCNKLLHQFSLHSSSLLPTQIDSNMYAGRHSQLSAISITRIGLEKETKEIFHYFLNLLKNYFNQLQNYSEIPSNSPSSSRKKDIIYLRETGISSLKDLSYILSCPQFSKGIRDLDSLPKCITETKVSSQLVNSKNTPSISEFTCDKNSKVSTTINSLLQILFKLSYPNTYPDGYENNEEIEWSLSALVSWSTSDFKSLLEVFDDQIILFHVNECHNIKASCLVMKLLLNMCSHKQYLTKLIHRNDSCQMCAISALLLHKISGSPLECIDLMLMVENVLSTIFTAHTFSDIKLEEAPCITLILQAFLTALFKFYKIRKDSDNSSLILKKGFTLIHSLSKYVPNFKGRRSEHEDLYVSLISGMLLISKEDCLFKDYYEIAHDLWDFQEDTSEFDLEDFSDDSMQTLNLLS